MKFKKLFNSSCVCCRDLATKDVSEIPLGEHILYDLIRYNEIPVSSKRFEMITNQYNRTHMKRYPLCLPCYKKVEAKWLENKAKSEALSTQKKKEKEINQYYEKLAMVVERKELELRAKKLGIDLENDIIK